MRGLRHGGLGLTLVLVLLMVVWVLFLARGHDVRPGRRRPQGLPHHLLNGVTAAGLYFVVASGFTLIFGLMRVVNMAHGAFFLLGGYIALKLQRHWVGEGAVFGLTSDQVNIGNWVLPRHRRAAGRPRSVSGCSRCSSAGTRVRSCARR